MKRFSSLNLTVLFLLFVLAGAFLAGSCAVEQQAPPGKIGVVVSIVPQIEFAESVGGDKITLSVMVPPGAEPHSYEPKTGQMVALAKASLYARVGSGIEFEIGYMDKIAGVNKNMLIIDCSQGINLMQSTDPHETGLDPHIWTSPKNTMVMVRNICDGLAQVDPDSKAYYENNRDIYIKKLETLDQDIASGLAAVKNRSFIAFHPAFSYFARDYNLAQISVEQEGKEPSAAYMTRLIQEAREKKITVIFVSPQFNQKSAEVIAREIGGRVLQIDPLAKDYIDNMEAVKQALLQAMQ